MSAFSSNEADVIERQVIIHPRRKKCEEEPKLDVLKAFEIDRCVEWIQRVGKERVGLQFPDELLEHSAKVASALEGRLGRKVYVLGDATYASCCVDEVAAEHLNIEAVIHFGHSCGSQSASLPTLDVFVESSFSVDSALSQLKEQIGSGTDQKFIVIYDPKYTVVAGELAQRLPEIGIPEDSIITTHIIANTGSPEHEETSTRCLGRLLAPLTPNVPHSYSTCLNSWDLIHVGDPSSKFLQNWIISFPLTRNEEGEERVCYCFDPEANVVTKKGLKTGWGPVVKRRFFSVEKAKDAQTIGLLVGTVGVKDYDKIVDRLKQILTLKQKNFHVFVVGKPNPAKLANFAEVDAYVLFACPETSLVDNPKDYLQPILTPYEMELACQARAVEKDRSLMDGMVVEFSRLLPGGDKYIEVNESNFTEPEDSPADVSLITNSARVQPSLNSNPTTEGGSQALVPTGPGTVALVASGRHPLSNRSWTGVEFSVEKEQQKNLVAEVGLSGRAAGYLNEPS